LVFQADKVLPEKEFFMRVKYWDCLSLVAWTELRRERNNMKKEKQID